MNKTDFIAELCKKTGLSTEDGSKVNDVIENNNLLGNAAKIISQIAEKLNISEEQAGYPREDEGHHRRRYHG